MKLLALASLTYLSLASAVSIDFLSSSSAKTLDDPEFKVPGEQPLYYCGDPSDYLLTVHNVDLDPNPPRPGEKLTIKANGTFSEQIDEGATVFLQVRYGLITLIKQEADLCDNLPKINIECPLEKGYLEIFKEVDIPKQVPPGKYSVLADVKTVDKREITCMQAQITFPR